MARSPATPEEPGGGILRVAIQRPVTVVVGALLVVLFGATSVVDLPIQLTPDIQIPTLTVSTRWPGASPTEIETEILDPQEDAVKDVQGLQEMTSEARPDQGQLVLEFAIGTDLDQALVRVSNSLTEVASYPEAADEPSVQTASSTGPPLAVIAIRNPDGEPVSAFRTWVEDRILPELQRVEGVGDVRLLGGQDSILRIDFDPGELAARQIPIHQMVARIRSELRHVSAGSIELGRRRLLVRTMAVPAEPDRVEDIVLEVGNDGTPIRLGDVAQASVALRDPQGVAMSDDRPSLVLLLDREAGSNVLEVTERIRATVERLDERVFRPEGLRMEVLSDQVDYIRGALDLVRQNLLIGAILAILVLILFLRSVGASAIVAVAIPICVFGTILGMQLLGRSINVVSLAGITFAIGMVLDNSIVSLESIDTHRSREADPKRAALLGIREVWGAILASTATTAAVFVPVIAWEGEVGQLLRDLAVAISFAVGTSLLVSIWVIPSLAARLPGKKGAGDAAGRGSPARRARTVVGGVVGSIITSKARSAAVVLAAVALSSAVTWYLLPPLEYLPAGNRNLVFGILTPPPGTAVSELERVAEQVQTRVAAQEDGAEPDAPIIARSFFVGSPDRLFAGAVAKDPDQVREMLGWLRGVQGSVPGFMAFTTQASLFGRSGGGRSIELNLTGSNLTQVTALAGRMLGQIRTVMPGTQVRPNPSLDPGTPELRAIPRRGEAAPLRMTTDQLGLAVDALVDGAIVGELGPEGEPQLDVVVRALRITGELDDPESLATAPIATPARETVPLSVLTDLREELGPTVIRRIERRRGITLEVAPPEEIPLETALQRLRAEVLEPLQRDGAIPPGIEMTVTGTAGDLEVAKSGFVGVLLLALVISFLLMSALFEDFLAPIVVLVTVPLAAAGGVSALRLVDALLQPQSLDLMTAVGFLILIGVVVNNAILVVDGSIARLREGAALHDAVVGAVESRVRPILMTTTTSLAGLLPMVIFSGSGSELYRGVGAIVLGGLISATAFTLVVVPSLFSLVWSARAAVAARFARN